MSKNDAVINIFANNTNFWNPKTNPFAPSKNVGRVELSKVDKLDHTLDNFVRILYILWRFWGVREFSLLLL